jgi:MarR family 2-MHQ and catechol resistance regulon transcriptional repressor
VDDYSGIRLWLILWKAWETMREHALNNIESLHLGLSDFGVLEVLLHKGPLPVNTIGGKLRLTSGAITTAIDRLAEKGLVERRDCPGDRRARLVHLTAKGRTLIECAFGRHEEAMAKAASGLSPAERAQAVYLLKKLGLHARSLLHEDTANR